MCASFINKRLFDKERIWSWEPFSKEISVKESTQRFAKVVCLLKMAEKISNLSIPLNTYSDSRYQNISLFFPSTQHKWAVLWSISYVKYKNKTMQTCLSVVGKFLHCCCTWCFTHGFHILDQSVNSQMSYNKFCKRNDVPVSHETTLHQSILRSRK